MPVTVMPSPYQTVLDGSGNPINGAKVFVYLAGTTTKTDTYTDSTGGTPNANPIIADSAGRFVAFLDGTVSYKFVYALSTDTDPPLSPFKTVDGILATAPFSGSVTFSGTLGENVSIRDLLYLSDGTGGLTAGRWYKTDADLGYKSSYARQYAFATEAGSTGDSITLIEQGELTGFAGLSTGATYYVSATAGALALTGYRAVAVAVSTTAIHVVHTDPAPCNVDELGVAGANLDAGRCCYLSNAGTWFHVDSDLTTTGPLAKNFGFAVEAIALGERGVIRRLGVINPQQVLVAGTVYYMGTTGGQITATAPVTYPQFPRVVGVAISTSELSISPTPPVQEFAYNGAQVGNVGAGEDDLITTPPIYANSLGFNGQVVYAFLYGVFASNVNNKRLRIKFDGTTVLDTGSAAFQGGWSAMVQIRRTNSTNQEVNATAWVAGQTVFNGNIFTTSAAVASDITLKCTGESAAAASNDIVQSGFSYRIGGTWTGA